MTNDTSWQFMTRWSASSDATIFVENLTNNIKNKEIIRVHSVFNELRLLTGYIPFQGLGKLDSLIETMEIALSVASSHTAPNTIDLSRDILDSFKRKAETLTPFDLGVSEVHHQLYGYANTHGAANYLNDQEYDVIRSLTLSENLKDVSKEQAIEMLIALSHSLERAIVMMKPLLDDHSFKRKLKEVTLAAQESRVKLARLESLLLIDGDFTQ